MGIDAKLKFKSGPAVILNSPSDFSLERNYDEKVINEYYDNLLVFTQDSKQLKSIITAIDKSLKNDPILWIAYPKKSSKIKTDFSRDNGWESLTAKGLRPVSLISLDSQWSALRFRPVSEVTPSKNTKTQIFEAELKRSGDLFFVEVPDQIFNNLGAPEKDIVIKYTVQKLKGEGTLSRINDQPSLMIDDSILKKAKEGETLNLSVSKKDERPAIHIPMELQQLLDGDAPIKSFYDSLSYTNRKEYAVWISSAKREETKLKRIQECKVRLENKVKNPSEKY
ncbi:YdeI/OmpD-associated family protein [Fulvivirga ligni]|uniref:YdeI/OmpD-associated family protein n=1 Tax=Fulvivirga ligni TaxID=2904246 RepID=UPI001F429184|nr:YdeI/OmpD-associated family protein [Fulvivirga ligni]UII22026.1 YdeI/OmpD-associated family protein [Fulvivirga ligni]